MRLLTDSAGNVTDTWDYDAFGNLIARTGATPNNYLYRGEQFDSDLGIYFQRARYYDQERGRFFSMDEFDGFTDEPISLHKYLYANADPVNFLDPSGFLTLSDYAVKVRAFVVRQVAALRQLSRQIACVIIKTASWINPALELPTSLLELAFCKCGVSGKGTSFVGGSNRPRIALGLGDSLPEFAQFTKSIPWYSWTGAVTRRSTVGKNFGRAFTDASRNASGIDFNLDGIENLADAFRRGLGGFRYQRNVYGEIVVRNATNTELTTIVRDPNLLNKTTFWRGGRRLPTTDVLREICVK